MSLSWARAPGRLVALRHLDQPVGPARGGLRHLLPARGRRESAQGTRKTAWGWVGPATRALPGHQVRVLLMATAYILFLTLQQAAQQTACARAEAETLLERRIKLGGLDHPVGAPTCCICPEPSRGASSGGRSREWSAPEPGIRPPRDAFRPRSPGEALPPSPVAGKPLGPDQDIWAGTADHLGRVPMSEVIAALRVPSRAVRLMSCMPS
jgi:hypothetical protein